MLQRSCLRPNKYTMRLNDLNEHVDAGQEVYYNNKLVGHTTGQELNGIIVVRMNDGVKKSIHKSKVELRTPEGIPEPTYEQLLAYKLSEAMGRIDEKWQDWVVGAGIGAAALGGMDAGYDYMTKQTQPQPQNNISVGKVAPKVEPSLMRKAVKPLEKTLIKAAETAGLKGAELQQFIAQCAHESMNFDTLEEIGSDKYISRKYDKKYNPAKAKVLGNVNIGDGLRFKGRGFIQLTGRYNYAKAGEALGLPLEAHPELVARPDVAAKVSLWFWNNRVAAKVQDFSNTKSATKPINPALKGLDKRVEKFKHYSNNDAPLPPKKV